MKTIIAGSRNIAPSQKFLEEIITRCNIEITEIVCGMAKGVDYAGLNYGEMNNIPVKKFPANWEKFGKSAGPVRNREMARYAEACIVIWDGFSRGSANMIKQAKENKLTLYIFNVTNGDLDIYPKPIEFEQI